MSNSDNIQSLFPSFQFHDSPFIQFYNHAENSNNSIEDQEYPPLLISSNSPSVIDELQKSPKPAVHGDVVDEKNRNKKKSIYPLRKRNHAPVSRRTGKKSRHSKICTAQGVRDRRMRLSIPTARKFFDLQDLLGFDKPSNTIEWLFSNSQKALEELHRHKLTQGTDGCSFEEDNEHKFIFDFDENPNNENGITKSRKQLNNHAHVKESRERARARTMARERARERTREKMKMKGIKQWYKSAPNKDDLEHSGHSCPLEDYSSSHTQNAGGPHERDSNSTSFMGILGDSYAYNSSIFSTIGLVTGKGIPNRKFPFLLQ